ncbi:MAG: phage major capsid protein [Actinomycetota bacterium]
MTIEELIASLREQREQTFTEMQQINTSAVDEKRDQLTEDEQTRYDAAKGKVEELDARIGDLEGESKRAAVAAAAAATSPGVQVTSDPLVYERGNPKVSFMRDLALAQVGQNREAFERLHRHMEQLPAAIAKRAAEGKLELRDISPTDTAGGEFVPPLWLLEEYAALARAARVTADLIGSRPLPPGTDSINIPRITTGATTATQAPNAAVSETDLVTASVEAPVRTIAGQEDAALQLIEQSPMSMDEVLFADLLADYAEQLDVNVINGNGTAPNHRGILNVTGINAVTYTDATPTVGELYPKIADAVNRVHANRFMAATAIVMHPRRWNWIMAALDTTNRPLAVPNPAYGGFNPIAVQTQVVAEGIAGTLLGLPVYLDANVPTNLGAGTDEDRIIVFRVADSLLFEGALRTRALQETLAGTLAVRFQVYAYSAFTAGRYPVSVSAISGTGLVAPTF